MRWAVRPQSRQSSRDVQRPDYTALLDGEGDRDRDFLAMLAAREFTPAAFPSIKGSDLTLAYLREHHFVEPFLVPSPEGLGMVMPGPDFSVDDVKAYVGTVVARVGHGGTGSHARLSAAPQSAHHGGSVCGGARAGGDREIFVIDVATQQEKVAWNMNQFAYYFSHPDVRRRIYNVISLEFSDSAMAAAVRRPAIVDALDWISLAWPPERVATRSAQEYPKVQMYCLMSVAGSYTDFHIDFGGSSVFYHLISGEKLFYFIPPTPDNLKRYERWSNSPDQSDTFFGDLAGPCLSARLLPGQTLFIPSGWIHAVATPRDSIVVGGNFVHALSVPMQLAVERIEEATQVPHRFRFPFFRHLHWFYAEYLLGRLRSGADAVASMSAPERDSVATLVRYLGSMLTPLKTAEDRANWKINSPFDRHRATALVRALAALLGLPETEVLGRPLGQLPIPALPPRYYEWSSPRKAKRRSPGA